MTARRLVSLTALAVAGFPSRGTAQAEAIDQATFRIMRDSIVAGQEEFTLRRVARGREGVGFSLSARATYPPDRPTLWVALTLEFGADSQMTAGQLDLDDGERQSVLVAVAGRRITVRAVSERGAESARQYPSTGRTVILDENLVAPFAVLPPPASGGITVIEPRKLSRKTMELLDHGREPTRVDGQTRTLRHLTLGSGPDLRHLWYDDDRRLWKVEMPAARMTAVRGRPPEP